MAKVTLRLFAGAREIAGAGTMSYQANTVQDLLTQAQNDLGDEFTRILSISRVWINGEPAEEDLPISDGDEVAVLPPVSGG
ncbi:MAG TPA: molybdopterin synthase sulfur carrier subunit [Acidimicrobiaceae bacterium]|nr:molybdopterin synthase sulfur carrier subunit [Acidimicrobiaceae bacterium]HAX05446.1 molybdopterin synthase sulfur carrier subunit [Acidimicrobiaceae bacterium]|tara:strand:+ start:305 stop:547 length:243 start_codon:yes stop_codon:yes gene_type:complete